MRALAFVDGEHYRRRPRRACAPALRRGRRRAPGRQREAARGARQRRPALPDLAAGLVSPRRGSSSTSPTSRSSGRGLLPARGGTLAAGLRTRARTFASSRSPSAPRPAGAGRHRLGQARREDRRRRAVARLLSEDRGTWCRRDGPRRSPRPGLTEASPTVDDLLALSRAGRPAASDHLEDAALAGVVTVGARRCGGGLAGRPLPRRRGAARLAASLEPDLVLLEGSGAAIPPVEAARRILVAGQPGPGGGGRLPRRLPDTHVRPGRSDHVRRASGGARADGGHAGRDRDVHADIPSIATVLGPVRSSRSRAAGRFFSTAPARSTTPSRAPRGGARRPCLARLR